MSSEVSQPAPSIRSVATSQQPLIENPQQSEQVEQSKPSTLSKLSRLNPLHRRPKETEDEKAARLAEEKRKKDMIKKYGRPPLWAQQRDYYRDIKGAKGGKGGVAALGAFAAAGGGA